MRRAVALPFAMMVTASSCDCSGDGLVELTRLLVPDATRVDVGDVYVGGTGRAFLELSSVGTGQVDIDDATLDAPFALARPLPSALAAGARADVEIAFAPREPGPAAALLVITSSAENDDALAIDLIGMGLTPLTCADGNDCTDDLFDPDTGVCSNPNRTGSCEDASACTVDDRCLDGACVGAAVACPEPADLCLRAVCDAAIGCVEIVDDDACDDGDPCTLNVCDSVAGCSNPDAPDGTPCGTFGGCTSFDVCVGGACTSFPVPDGTFCIDGDVCTVDDVCTDGACAGTSAQVAPVVVQTLRAFGGEGSLVIFLSDERLLFADSLAIDPASFLARGVLLTAVDVVGETLVKRAELLLPAVATAKAMIAVTAERAALIDADGVLTVFDVVAADGSIAERGASAPLHEAGGRDALGAFAESVVYASSLHSGGVTIVDIVDPDAPVEVGALPLTGTEVFDLTVDVERAELVLAIDGPFAGSFEIHSLDPDPRAPVARASVPFDGPLAVRAADGRIALLSAAAFDQSTTVNLFDAASLAPTSVLTFPQPPTTHIALGDRDDSLWTGSSAGIIKRRSLVGPADEAVALTPPSVAGRADAAHLVVRGARAAVGGGDPCPIVPFFGTGGVGGSVVFAADDGGAALRPLSGPGHGSLHTLVSRGGAIYSVDEHAVQLMTLDIDSVPSFIDGTADGVAVPLVSVGGAGAAPSVLVIPSGEGDPLVGWADHLVPSGAVPWADGATPSLGRVPVGALSLGNSARAREDVLVDVIDDLTGPLRFLIHVKRIAPPSPPNLIESAEVDIPNATPAFDVHAIGIDALLSRVVVGLNTAAEGLSVSQLMMLDIDAVAGGTTMATTGIVDQVRFHSVAVDGDRVLVVESTDTIGHHVIRFLGSRLVMFTRDTGALDRRGEVALAESDHVLAFEGAIAVIATRRGLAFVDVGDADAPAILDELALDESPISGVFFDDSFVVATESSLHVISPPCPP